MENTGKIKAGIAGLGRSGWNIHADAIEKMADMYRVAAVCEKDGGRAAEAKEKFGCRTYSAYEDLISDDEVELVIVATPNQLHSKNSIDAMRAGKNVVCEKPMAVSLEDADEMIKTASETGKTLTIFQNRRYVADFRKVMEVVSSGKLGRIVMVKMMWQGFGRRWDWQTLKKFGGGELKNTCPHAIDQALQFFTGAEPEIFCHMEKTMTLGDAEDHVKIIFKLDGFPVVDLEVTKACAYPGDKWKIMGTQGGLAGSFTDLKWKYFKPEDLPPREVDTSPTEGRTYNSEEIPWQPEEEWSAGGEEDPKILFYRELYEALRAKTPVAIKPEDVRKQISVIQKCQEMSPV